MPEMTDTKRDAFAEFLEWARDAGIDVEAETGWVCTDDLGWHKLVSGSGWRHIILLGAATLLDYNAACWVMGRWLREKCDRFVDRNIDGDWEAVHTNWYDEGNGPIKLDCPDDELSAMLAAAREVG